MGCKMVFVVLIGCYNGYVHAATPQHCSKYVVSGLYGVDNSALTSTRTHKDDVPGTDFYPKNSRLYSAAPTLGGSAGWCSYVLDTHQYLQIELPQETIIHAAIIQGRGDHAHYVTSYYLLYSIDGVTWTTVTTADGNPKVFPGNSDSHTPVPTAISPTITARYIRVNPQTWFQFICFRFDLSGCRPLEQDAGFKSLKFKKTSITLTTQLTSYQILQHISSTLLDCSRACCTNDQCQSLTFNSTGNMCNMYSKITTTTSSVGGFPYYYSTALTDSLNYKPNQDGVGLYKVNEIQLDQSSASETCKQQYSTLMKIETSSQMSYLQGIISGNTILSQDFRFYVSGQYVTEWRYDDGTQMTDSSLWSPSQPNPSHGTCVMLTQSGLSSVVCSQLLFSICRH